jgi:hypothetical protein
MMNSFQLISGEAHLEPPLHPAAWGGHLTATLQAKGVTVHSVQVQGSRVSATLSTKGAAIPPVTRLSLRFREAEGKTVPALMVAGNIPFCYKCGQLGAHRPLDCRMDFPAKARMAQEEKLAKAPLLVEPEAAPAQARTQAPTVADPGPSQAGTPTVLDAAPSTAEQVPSHGEDEPAKVPHEMSVSSESLVPMVTDMAMVAPEAQRAPADAQVETSEAPARVSAPTEATLGSQAAPTEPSVKPREQELAAKDPHAVPSGPEERSPNCPGSAERLEPSPMVDPPPLASSTPHRQGPADAPAASELEELGRKRHHDELSGSSPNQSKVQQTGDVNATQRGAAEVTLDNNGTFLSIDLSQPNWGDSTSPDSEPLALGGPSGAPTVARAPDQRIELSADGTSSSL